MNKITVKNRITVNLEDSEYRALQRIATNIDRSLAWLGRQAIRDFIRREGDVEQLAMEFTGDDISNTRHISQ